MELFRMTLGVWDYEELRSSYYHWLTQMFFILFLVLVPILLLNMLIAMMGNTYSEIIGKSEREFALQWANIIMEIERSLDKKEAYRFVDQYTIVNAGKGNENPRTTLMVSASHFIFSLFFLGISSSPLSGIMLRVTRPTAIANKTCSLHWFM